MKRFIQIVALVAVSLLAAQPALANVSCPHPVCGMDHSAFNCCMHAGAMPIDGMSSNDAMDSMSAVCQMEWRPALAESDCGSQVFCGVPVSSMARPIAAGQRKAGDDLSATTETTAPAATALAGDTATTPPGGAQGPSAAKYVLFHAFRI